MGLSNTFQLLTRTDNEAAVRVLVPALDSPHTAIREAALVALLKRRSLAGGREILRRLPTLSERFKTIIRQHQGWMTRTLRNAILGTDRQMVVNGCRAAVWFCEYDLIPTLLNVLEDYSKTGGNAESREDADRAGETLLGLTGALYEELAGTRDYAHRRDPQLVRNHVVGSLELSLKRFARHRRREVIEAFLLLARHDNAILKQILQDPHHAAFLTTIEVMSSSSQGGVIRLLLSLLDDPHAPSAALSVIAKRRDLKFVRYLLRKIGQEPSATVAQNLKRIESVAWLSEADGLLEQLDDAAQHGAVRLVIGSGISRLEAFATIEYILVHGKPGGRREAARALVEFNGAEANALALKALSDPDPQVQANIIGQLRRRGIPGILPRLVELVDSRYALVRRTARENLEEFTFARFVSAFDMLDDEVRQSTAMLVKKIDPRTVPLLKNELQSRVRRRQLRGLAMAAAMELVESVEGETIDLLREGDHIVRAAAAAALAQSRSQPSRLALTRALGDRNQPVREAARKSLNERGQYTPESKYLSHPQG